MCGHIYIKKRTVKYGITNNSPRCGLFFHTYPDLEKRITRNAVVYPDYSNLKKELRRNPVSIPLEN